MLRASPALLAALLGLASAAHAQEPTGKGTLREAIDELIHPLKTSPYAGTDLDVAEREADRYFRRVRDAEIDRYHATGVFPGAQPFHRGKGAIEVSRVFAILRRMPKGAALHVHSSAAGRARWIVYNACYRENCYVYWPAADPGPAAKVLKGQLCFFAPGKVQCGFRPTADVRNEVPDFDRQLLALLTLGPEDEAAPDIWAEFAACFQRQGNVLGYQPVFRDYFIDAFETLAADGVDHVELRTPQGPLFDLDGRCWSGVKFVDEFFKCRDAVRGTYPDFNLKLIIAGSRFDTAPSVWWQLTEMIPIRVARPHQVVGYDLVGEEDAGYPTAYYASILLYAKLVYKCVFHVDLPLYLHDGESNWKRETNLRFAFSLFTRRVGHGLNLHFFPKLEGLYIARPTPLEVCPISNQMLRYVADLRLHPAEAYIRHGVVCALSSDDPGIFGSDGLSYDFWEATMSWELGLVELKRLARNSIEYSAMTRPERERALRAWEAKWKTFIDELNQQRSAMERLAADGRR